VDWVASQRSIIYKASDGLDIHALVTLPPQGEAKSRALIVLPHDGPLAHDSRGFDWLAQALASRGYVVLQPNYRGSDGYGSAFVDAGKGQWSSRMLSDIDEGVRYLTAQGIADPKRVCIAGQGFGGYAALKAAQEKDTPYRCAASIDGIADVADHAAKIKSRAGAADDISPLTADPRQSRAFRADAESSELFQTYLGSNDLTAISPLKNTTRTRLPVLLIQYGKDRIVSAAQGHAMRDSLQGAGKPLTYAEFSDCDARLTIEDCRLRTVQVLVDFLAVQNPAH